MPSQALPNAVSLRSLSYKTSNSHRRGGFEELWFSVLKAQPKPPPLTAPVGSGGDAEARKEMARGRKRMVLRK